MPWITNKYDKQALIIGNPKIFLEIFLFCTQKFSFLPWCKMKSGWLAGKILRNNFKLWRHWISNSVIKMISISDCWNSISGFTQAKIFMENYYVNQKLDKTWNWFPVSKILCRQILIGINIAFLWECFGIRWNLNEDLMKGADWNNSIPEQRKTKLKSGFINFLNLLFWHKTVQKNW